MSTINVNSYSAAPRQNNTFFWNEDNTIRVRVEVHPGQMSIKLERQEGTLDFATRHGHTLEEVTARAMALVSCESFPEARNLFRAQQGMVPAEMKDGRKFRCLA